MTNEITLAILLFPWAVWLGWELYLLVRRARGERVQTISMVARDVGWRMASLVYAWCGLAAHYWWSAEWGSTLTGVAFWAILAALLAWDLVSWRSTAAPVETWPAWRRWARWPLLWAVVGIAAGRFLFPQHGPTPWSP